MPSKSTRSRARRKSLPSDFPLTKHPRGYWCKKIKGKLHYFGKVADDPEGRAALEEWSNSKESILLYGYKPDKHSGKLTVGELVNEYLNARRLDVEAGELAERSHREYRLACVRLVDAIGKSRAAADMGPDDFARIKNEITKHCGAVRTKNEITRIKGLFRWGVKQGLLEKLPRYGAAFDPPSAKTLRLAKAAKGERLFAHEEVLTLLKSANVQQTAHILLALNCGYGASDISALPISAVDLEGGWIDFARVKTGSGRRCWLWPETRTALAAAMEARVPAEDPADDDKALLTRYGKPLVRDFKGAPEDTIAVGFRRLLAKVKLDGKGLSFYRLRHTHRTVADESGDQPACAVIMGHADHTMAGNYRQRVKDERLQHVAGVVRQWLFPIEDDKAGDDRQDDAKPKLRIVG